MADKKVLIENKAVPVEETKAVFGALSAPTPQWVKVTISVTTRVTAAAAIFLAATNLLPESSKFEILLGIKALDFFVVELGKMVGLVEK